VVSQSSFRVSFDKRELKDFKECWAYCSQVFFLEAFIPKVKIPSAPSGLYADKVLNFRHFFQQGRSEGSRRASQEKGCSP